MERMSDNTSQRKALQQLESESDYDRITYYQKPFMKPDSKTSSLRLKLEKKANHGKLSATLFLKLPISG